MRYFYRKNQRLHKEADIAPLFKEGKGVFSYPIKAIYRLVPLAADDVTPCKVVMVVAKRHLKKAFMRNLVRRRMRESYRLNVNTVVPPEGFQVQMAFIFVAQQVVDYKTIEGSIKYIFRELNVKINRTVNSQ